MGERVTFALHQINKKALCTHFCKDTDFVAIKRETVANKNVTFAKKNPVIFANKRTPLAK